MADERRWTIYEHEHGEGFCDIDAYRGSPQPGDVEGIGAMPVAEHERLLEGVRRGQMSTRDELIALVEQALAHGCGRCGATLEPCSDCADMTTYSRFPAVADRVADAILRERGRLMVDDRQRAVDAIAHALDRHEVGFRPDKRNIRDAREGLALLAFSGGLEAHAGPDRR